MADDRGPRPSTDEERAPLLADSAAAGAAANPSFAERVSAVVQEPLTALSKLLLVLVLVFLLISSVFIGLFAGAQHKLNQRKNRPEPADPVPTITQTATATVPASRISTVYPPSPTKVPDHDDNLCFTTDCIRLSADILSSIDTSYDPCENFYEFANNGWLKEHPLPADKGVFGAFNDLAVKNQQLVRELLESDTVPSGADSAADAQLLAKLRGMYGSCMNEDELDRLSSEPLRKVARKIRELYGGKTAIVDGLTGQNKTEGGLTAALAYLHTLEVPALFDFSIDGDSAVDPDNMTLWFSQPDLGLPSKEYYEEESVVKLYENTIERLLIELDESDDMKVVSIMLKEVDVENHSQLARAVRSKPRSHAKLAAHHLDNGDDYVVPEVTPTVFEEGSGVPAFVEQDEDNSWPPWPWPPWSGDEDDGDDDDKKTPVDFAKLAKGVVALEKQIANASLDLDILQQDPWATYNPAPIANLTSALPAIRFSDYFAAFTPRNFPERVIVSHPPYVAALAEILNYTRADVLEAYLVSRAALALAPYLGRASEAWQAQRALVEALSGIKPGAVGDRSEFCVGRIEGTLGFAAGRYFANLTFGEDARAAGTKVITDIVTAFKHSLGRLDWMDAESAARAAQKADKLDVKVGYPLSPDTRDARALAGYYYLVKIDEKDFLGNVLSGRKSDVYKTWQKLGKRRNKQEWLMYPSQVNAYYNPPGNEIVFPAGILRSPFFGQNWPGYLAYGAFGMVAAHELTHAFDSAGRLYNQDGKLEEWWTNGTTEAFKARQTCIVDQYAKYYVKDAQGNKVHVNGNLTSGENIGDSGIIQAYRAWKAQYSASLKDGNEYTLPGLPYTKEQLFFIAFGRVWAQNIKPAAAVQRVRTDPHSPNNFRVEGTLFNVPEFAKAFNCSAKAKLNPPKEQRCQFWG